MKTRKAWWLAATMGARVLRRIYGTPVPAAWSNG
jgi:hypothetical protein